ncbi:MAG: D-aminoacyl-tRNA deacylase [Chitinispirillia bacterium]|jgi:D-tyrosyl-tRNA(Tyr) deacylase
MKIVLQRVKQAKVTVNNRVVGSINRGILIFLGIHIDDTTQQADYLAAKCAELRIFSDSDDKMNFSCRDLYGEALVVSQFTLYGDCRKGRRPSYAHAAPPYKGNELYEYFVKKLKDYVDNVQTGIFGAMMDVKIINDGPVTLILER